MTNVFYSAAETTLRRPMGVAPSFHANRSQWGPQPWTVALILALFLLPVALIPASRGRLVPIPLLARLWWTDVLVIVFGFLVLSVRLAGFYRWRAFRSTRRWFLYPLLTLALWQAVSILWNGRDGLMKTYSLLETMCMCSGILGGVFLLSGLPRDRLLSLGRLITLLVTSIIVVYMGISFVFPNWRPSAVSSDLQTPSLGFIRVFGPLGSATTLNFAIIPALGFAFGRAVDRSATRTFWTGVSLLLLGAVLGTGSRGGVLCLAAFVVMIVLVLRLRSLTVLFFVAIVLGMLIAVFGIPERYRSFRDRGREVTYATAWRAFTSSPQATLLGLGHGALYSRFHDETQRKQLGKSRWHLLTYRTPYGPTLRASHTAILRTLAETGMVGGILLLIPLLWILLNTLAPGHRHGSLADRLEGKACLAGCASVIPYMALDEFFVGAVWILVLWVSYVVIGSELVASNKRRSAIVPGFAARGFTCTW